MNSYIRQLIIKSLWTVKAIFACDVLTFTFVPISGVMSAQGGGEECDCGANCGCDK